MAVTRLDIDLHSVVELNIVDSVGRMKGLSLASLQVAQHSLVVDMVESRRLYSSCESAHLQEG